MKKFENLGRTLSKAEQRKILGGAEPKDNSCNTYCGSGSGVTCTDTCTNSVDAGNGSNPNVPGGDKLCVR